MSQQRQISPQYHRTWKWPLDPTKYDRFPGLYEEERAELDRRLGQSSYEHNQIHKQSKAILHRLLQPIEDVYNYLKPTSSPRNVIERVFLIEIHRRGTSFWAWNIDEWKESVCTNGPSFCQRYGWQQDNHHPAHSFLPQFAYLLDVQPDTCSFLEMLAVQPVAQKIFGQQMIDLAVQRVLVVLQSWGYQPRGFIINGFTYVGSPAWQTVTLAHRFVCAQLFANLNGPTA